MAEIDTRPLESVQATVIRFSPDSNEEEEIVSLTKELATCKLQREVKENEHKNAMLKIEALQKAMQELSERHDLACHDAHGRIAQLEAENAAAASRQSATAEECRALRVELAAVRGQLDAARASIAYALGEVEAMEARAVMERESTREALARILQLNETVLSSAVAAVRAEEERSVFFQEVTLELFNSDKNLEVIRRQVEAMDAMERELLAKTVEIEYLRSELKQVKELYVPSPQEVSEATVVTAGCENSADRQVKVCDTTADHHQEPEAEFTFQHGPEECFVSEIFRNDGQVVPSGETKMEIKISEDVVVEGEGTEAVVQDTTELEGDSDAQEIRCLVDEISGDHHAVQQAGKDTEAEDDHELEADGQVDDHRQGHEDPKVDASFVLESSRDDFQSVRSDDKDISNAMPVNVAGDQEPRAEAIAPATTLRNGDSDIDLVAKEIVVSKDEDEFYTEELEPKQGHAGKLDGYVLVAKGADAAAKDKQLDAARTEISDLRFSLEEAVRRAELAEEAKAALERELREEIRKKRRPPRPASDSEDAIRPTRERPPPMPARPRPTPTPSPSPSPSPTPTPGRAQRVLTSARPGGEDMPTPRCVTLGKVLNMKYK